MTWVTGQLIGEEGLADGMEGDLRRGRTHAICDGGREARGAVCGDLPAVRREPESRLQVAWALSGSGRRGFVRSLAGAAQSSAGDCGRDRRALRCGAPGASDLGTCEGARLSRAAGAGDPRIKVRGLAGGEHDRPLVRPRRADGEAQAASPQSALERAVRRLRRGQRRVVHRLQGLVFDRRRRPLRTADAHRRDEPLSVALSGAGEVRRRARLAGARRRLPRIRPAASGFAPTTARHSPRPASAGCRAFRFSWSRPGLRRSGSLPASRSRTDATSACI